MALLQPFDILNSILQTIFIVTTIVVGLTIASKYSKYKDRVFLMVGFAWIGMVEPWMASVSNFFYTLITGSMFNVQIYLLIGMSFIPISIIFWFVAITDLMYKKRQKLILTIIIVYGIFFEIYFLYYLINDPSVLAVLHGVIDIEYKLPIQLYVFSVLFLGSFTGLLFSRTSIKSENAEVQAKGKLLFVAFILFIAGAISDTIFLRDIPTLFITRIILISASIFFYFGFIFPNFIKKRFES
ncbi:MAG: hypothetical protein EU535_03415 [Promethearchaeota archaeon]|nr:MAG: hypothetical protein EU535_03415 [Candidatus Lokiarchaeota archaeon]